MDTTLNVSGAPADAKVSGDAIREVSATVTALEDASTENIKYGAKLLTTSPFASNNKLYISKIDNVLYAANKRYDVSFVEYRKSDDSVVYQESGTSTPFNGRYDDVFQVSSGCYRIIKINIPENGQLSTYPYGHFIMSFYHNTNPESVSWRSYCHDSAYGNVGWSNWESLTIDSTLTKTGISGDVWTAFTERYAISAYEFKIVAPDDKYAWLCELEFAPTRPDPDRTPFLSKYIPETLYYELTAPSFNGLATNATSDASGNVISATYETKGDSEYKHQEALAHADTIKEDILAIKQDKLTGTSGQIVTFDENGNAIASAASGGTNIVLSDVSPDGLGDGDYWHMVMNEIESPRELFPYTVTLVNGTGYTLSSEGSTSPVYRGDSYSVRVFFASGYKAGTEFAVKANGVKLGYSGGTYTVYNITEDQVITVEGVTLETYGVVLPSSPVGYTVTSNNGSSVEYGGSYAFNVSIANGYEAGSGFAVKANGKALTASNGVYTISNITATQTITVEGVVLKTYTVTLPTNQTGYTVTANNGSISPVSHGGSYTFTVSIADGYEAGTGFAVKANGATLTASGGMYTISNITANQTITVEGVAASKTIVNITGSGNTTYCYATVNGTKRYSATNNLEVNAGDTITFGVYGRSTTYAGTLNIDGTEALRVTNQQTKTYEWTVPAGVKTITINMSYTSTSTQRRGTITVTTAK